MSLWNDAMLQYTSPAEWGVESCDHSGQVPFRILDCKVGQLRLHIGEAGIRAREAYGTRGI